MALSQCPALISYAVTDFIELMLDILHRGPCKIVCCEILLRDTKCWPALCSRAYIMSANVQVACMGSYALLILLVLTVVHAK